MSSELSKILVVSNLAERTEIERALVEGGFSELLWGEGGDETYALYDAAAPAVAIMCANLESGDARALAAAMKAGRHGGVHIILVGESAGPIRNALDAGDFQIDRFVARPLSAKALLYSVRAGLEHPATPPPTAVDQALELAIEDFVSDAIGSLGELTAEAAPFDHLPLDHDEVEDEVLTSADASSAATAPVPSPAAVAVADRRVQLDDAWDDAPPAREPTLILSGGGIEPEAARPAPSMAQAIPQPVPVDLTERESDDVPWNDRDSVSLDPLSDDYSDAEILLAADRMVGLEDELSDLDDDLRRAPMRPAQPIAVPAPPEGGAFARDLRRKMSQMAERLFPHRKDGDRPIVEVGVSHGHETEIDLAALAIETRLGLEPEPAPYADLASAETYADAEHGGTGSGDMGTGGSEEEVTERRTAGEQAEQSGDLGTHDGDVAIVLARAYAANFTGRVVFRAPPAEKTVHFDAGRPVFATSNRPHDRMGDLLYREGKITAEQFTRSRELLVESGRRMGEILVEMGFLKRRELLPAVRRHIEDILYSLFALTEGQYVMEPGEHVAAERIRLSRHPAALILEGIRRKYSLEQLERRLGAADAVIAVRDPERLKPILSVADLSRSERNAIAALDGDHTLEEVARVGAVSLLEAYQLAFGLVALDAA
ncbi:MAG TPA: DUF4388 domain-containing protein, partial [Kofleriaceae bacterium]|nr:DUF4388 domain-containing protein [Kofleriaceae bacterium]